ncbi:MAG TPA: hypothetical protein ENI81_13290, partial [Phycisphaerales bacterium]|nr:hypothetical protein [Phycisphaerales bacterium]
MAEIEFDPAKSFLDRWDSAADSEKAIQGLADWICKYTYLEDDKFSFHEHEYQIQIANDTHARMNVMKASQVGMTELSARIVLAYVATHSNRRALYGLPTTTFAQSFSKDRIALVIENSPKLREMVASKNDTVLQKIIGTSILYLQGLSGRTAGFSLPLFLLVVDEVDICDQDILSRANSRLRHAPLDQTGQWRGLRRYFGTPSVLDYGIHHQIKLSDQHHYLVKCEHCNTVQAPTTHDFVIPGFEKDFSEFDIADVYDPLIDLDSAYMACQHCKKPIDNSLKDPERRQWVPAKQEQGLERGYSVAPWDLPVYNTTQSILKQRADYKTKAEYYNQILGLPYEDADNSFILSVFDRVNKSQWLDPNSPTSGRYFIGVDVGKIFHVVVIKPTSRDDCEVVYATTLTPYTENGEVKTNAMQVVELAKKLHARGTVIDAGPDFTSASYVTSKLMRSFASE